MTRTLLCYWYGEPLYEEDAPREKLIELIKFMRKEHAQDIETLDHLAEGKDMESFFTELLAQK